MIRLRNPDVSRIKEEALRFIRALGYDEPLPLYRRGVGEQHFATQDFADAMSLILDSIEGVKSREHLAGTGPETIREDEQRVEPHSLSSALGGANGGETESALSHDLLTREAMSLPQVANSVP